MQTLRLKTDQPFSLNLTLSCGQVFRWDRKEDGWWSGIVAGRIIRIRQDKDKLTFTGADRRFIEHYFSLDIDLPAVTKSFDNDPFIHAAIRQCEGLRLIRQPPWECLISYICATNSNIPMIKRRIGNIARHYGPAIKCDGRIFYMFPEPGRLAGSCASILRECKTGYRGPYIQKTACDIPDIEEWSTRIYSLSCDTARKELMKLKGVGPKAADCVLLFAFQKYDAFPVDVWIRRIMQEQYLPLPETGKPLTAREYNTIRKYARAHFGPYCGYAQEYLYAARASKKISNSSSGG